MLTTGLEPRKPVIVIRRLPVMRPVLLLLAALSAGAYGQSSSQPTPLILGKAALMKTIKSANLKPGDLFYLRTIGPWQQGDCKLAPNITITGQVAAANTSPRAVLSLQFSPVPCSGPHPVLMRPALVAVEAPSDATRAEIERNGSGAAQKDMLAGLFSSTYGDVSSSSNNPITNGASNPGFSGMMNALRDAPVPEKPLKTGEVRGYRGIDLDLPHTKSAVTSLSSSHIFTLNRETEFAFAYVPAQPDPPPPVPSAESAKDPVTAPAPPQPPADEIADVCVSSGCTELAETSGLSSGSALWTLPLVNLGYQARPHPASLGLDHTASVYFFGEDQLLLTFTRHTLVPRSDEQNPSAGNPRSVRGVLISRTDGRVLHIKDWTVSDDIGPFVWSFGKHGVLAHVGHDLVVFGPDLSIQKRFPLPGPLLFLSVAPQGNLLVVATVHEKHTPQEHAKISAFLGPGLPVSEEYDLTGLNDALQVTGAKRVTIEPTRPALLQNSMVDARLVHSSKWVLERSSWEGKSKPLALFRSTCALQVRSLPGDLLLAQGCPPTEPFATWYRVLNPQGAVLLKGAAPFGSFIQQAESSPDGKLLAVACSHFDYSLSRTTPLQLGEFSNLTVTIYNTRTGKQIFVARLPQGSAEQDALSLSPSGSTLAVLTSGDLQIFDLAPSAPAPRAPAPLARAP